MTFRLSDRSLDRLKGVHPDLVATVKRAIELTTVDFGVTEGVRDFERQKKLVAEGRSQTMNSKHQMMVIHGQ
jgi:peptidoglycan L-alanyl-D-glutamate endopeptidase CwlK